MLRNLAKTVLERCGYSVLLAEDGAKGIAQFALSPGEVVLVILDFAMPGLSSVETLQRLRAIRPELKVMLSSGYSEDSLRGFEGTGLAGFLQKPFTAQALVDKVKAVINGGLASAGVPQSLMVAQSNDTAHPS
jgi:DNA-binding response OmpR family regulator